MNSIKFKSHLHKNFASARGSVLIVILLAVGLFGTLSYTVANMLSTDGGTNTLSKQQAGLYASEVLQYSSSLRTAVYNLKISNECENTQISFEKPPFDNSDGYRNANSPSDYSCHLFHPEGGGVTAGAPNGNWQDQGEAAARSGVTGEYLITANICIAGVGSGDAADCGTSGNSDSEIILIAPWLSEAMCKVINEQIGISEETMPTFGTYVQFLANHSEKFVGSFPTTKESAGADALIFGKQSFCAQDTTSASVPGGGYHFYATLLAR